MSEDVITAKLVSDNDRLSFLPRVFGPSAMMRAEGYVYDWMGRLCKAYGGGLWDFYQLSNGGMFMAPHGNEVVSLTAPFNGYTGSLSSQAAGIVATLFALCQLLEETQAERFEDLYYALRDFAGSHAESRAIMQAID